MTSLLDKKFEKDVLEAYEAELPKTRGVDYITEALIDVGADIGTYDLTTIFDNYDFEVIEEDVYNMLIDYIDYLVLPENIDDTWRCVCADFTFDEIMEYVNFNDDKEEIERHYSAVGNEHQVIDYNGFGSILKSLLKSILLEYDPKWFNDLESVYIDAIEKVFNKKVEMLDD